MNFHQGGGGGEVVGGKTVKGGRIKIFQAHWGLRD